MTAYDSFDRCLFCFEPKQEPGLCQHCGYEDGLYDQPAWRLMPGSVLKGRYMVGRHLAGTATEQTYLAWDMAEEVPVEAVEYFPQGLVTRDITHSDRVSCIPGREAELETGCQAFFEKAKLFFQCVSRVEDVQMDYFYRNNTCYYVRRQRGA